MNIERGSGERARGASHLTARLPFKLVITSTYRGEHTISATRVSRVYRVIYKFTFIFQGVKYCPYSFSTTISALLEGNFSIGVYIIKYGDYSVTIYISLSKSILVEVILRDRKIFFVEKNYKSIRTSHFILFYLRDMLSFQVPYILFFYTKFRRN